MYIDSELFSKIKTHSLDRFNISQRKTRDCIVCVFDLIILLARIHHNACNFFPYFTLLNQRASTCCEVFDFIFDNGLGLKSIDDILILVLNPFSASFETVESPPFTAARPDSTPSKPSDAVLVRSCGLSSWLGVTSRARWFQ